MTAGCSRKGVSCFIFRVGYTSNQRRECCEFTPLIIKMKSYSKIQNTFNFPSFSTSGLIFIISCTLFACGESNVQTVNNRNKKEVELYAEYKNNRQQQIKELNVEFKGIRADILETLKLNPIYVDLVQNRTIKQDYLILLQAVGEGIISRTKDQNFTIKESTFDLISHYKGRDKFVIDLIRLDIFGGLPNELLDVYEQYAQEYGMSGFKGDRKYDTDGKLKHKVDRDYTLVQTLAVIDNKNSEVLDAYYEAVSSGQIGWSDNSTGDYVYDYLTDKYLFNNYLKANYPESKYYVDYDLKIKANDLYQEYEANEIAADEEYKGKRIAVTGTIENIGNDVLDKAYITLGTTEFGTIQCYFTEKNVVKNLSKGKSITIVGNCSGKTLGNIILLDTILF